MRTRFGPGCVSTTGGPAAMVRCTCDGSTCRCVIVGGDGIIVTGTGSRYDPYTIDGANISDFIDVLDSPTMNWTRTGGGTDVDPYVLTAVPTVGLLGHMADMGAGSPPAAGQIVRVTGPSTWVWGDPPDTEPGSVNTAPGVVGTGGVSSPLGLATSGLWGAGVLALTSVDSTDGDVVYVRTADGALYTTPWRGALRQPDPYPGPVGGPVTYTVPPAARQLRILLIGGGGAGGGVAVDGGDNQTGGGGGGGSAIYVVVDTADLPFNTLRLRPGAGGAPVVGGGVGGSGQASYLDFTMTADEQRITAGGGAGGEGGYSVFDTGGVAVSSGGQSNGTSDFMGGTPHVTLWSSVGSSGGRGVGLIGGYWRGGIGGSSVFGGGAVEPVLGSSSGVAASTGSWGGGGSGATGGVPHVDRAGGGGHPGVILIEELY